MSMAAKLRRAPARIVTGAFILNSGLQKLQGDEETAKAIHGMASGAYPVFGNVEPKTFLRLLGFGETALGATLLSNLVKYEFHGQIYPVNPKRDELLGLKVYHSVDELPEGIDCAVLAIPRDFVLGTVKSLAEKGCGAVVIYSAGFSEAGEQGMKAQQELASIANAHGMIIEVRQLAGGCHLGVTTTSRARQVQVAANN